MAHGLLQVGLSWEWESGYGKGRGRGRGVVVRVGIIVEVGVGDRVLFGCLAVGFVTGELPG